MDETNPTDTTANPATGTNTAPAVSTAPENVAAALPAAATVPAQSPLPAVPPPPPAPPVQPPVLPVQPIPVPPPPIQPIQPSQSEIRNTPAEEVAPIPAGEKPAPSAAPAPAPKPLREDIARIIGKIKLPERITLKMSGEKAKPPVPPPILVVPPAPEKKSGETGAPLQSGETPAQAPREGANAPQGEQSSVASVHTLKDDLQNVVRDKKMSLVRAVALESEKKQGQEHLAGPRLPAEVRSRKVIGIAFVATVVLALGLAAFFGARSVLEQNAGNAQTAAAPSLIFAEKTFMFPQETRTGIDLRRTLMAAARSTANIPLGAIIHIVPTSSQTDASGAVREQPQSIGDFLNAIGAQATPELIRSFSGDFFLGLHQTVGKLSPVIIIPVTSYERAFAGMLAWEPTMNADLSPIFTAVAAQTVNDKGLFVERQFQDTLINNYDVRVLKDDTGATQLLYSFPTRTMLIISESPYSFTEVLSRLRANRQL